MKEIVEIMRKENKKDKINKRIRGFIKSKASNLISFIGIFLILYLLFFLYELPLEPIVYGSILSCFFMVLLTVFQWRIYYKKVEFLNHVIESKELVSIPMEEEYHYIEELYMDIVQRLNQEKINLINDNETKYIDTLDYYTMWAHQIKTPLSALKLMVQAEEGINKILLVELFKIEQYVDMVLQYLRLGDISKDLVIGTHSLDRLVKQSIRKYATLFIYNKIALEVEEIEDKILTDEKWFVFIIEQILSNGIKYNKEKGKIKIYSHPKIPHGIVIEDFGIGIQEEDISRVFEKGFTGLNGRFDKRSTGIGLYLCKRICNKLSHKIYIESSVGEGTKVIIEYGTYPLEVE